MNESRPGEKTCSCRDVEPMLAAYVDGDTASCDCDTVQAHVDACACCRDRVSAERAAREALHARREGLRANAPETLKARCAAYATHSRIDSSRADRAARSPRPRVAPAPARRRPLLHWAPVSVAATILLAVATVFGFGLTEKAQALAFQTTIDHVKCSRFNAGDTPVSATDVERQWRSRFGWAISAPEPSKGSGLELRGVRRCGVMDGRVAHLMYSWNGEPLSVYVLPKRTLGDAARLVHRFKHNSVMWSQNDRTYIIVTAHPRDSSLDAMVSYVRASTY